MLSDSVGAEIRHVRVSEDGVREAIRQATENAWLADAVAGLYAAHRDGRDAAATDAFRDLTGRDARSLAEFAREHADVLGNFGSWVA